MDKIGSSIKAGMVQFEFKNGSIEYNSCFHIQKNYLDEVTGNIGYSPWNETFMSEHLWKSLLPFNIFWK